MTIPARWHVDSSHAWLEVPAEVGRPFGTGFGFVAPSGRTVFLEEDCEAPAFMAVHGDDVELGGRALWPGDAPCRGFARLPDLTRGGGAA